MQQLSTRTTHAVCNIFFYICLLVATGCTSSIPEDFDVQGWLAAVATGDTESVKGGLEKGVPPTIRGDNGFTALQVAVRQGRHETARALIGAGAKVNDSGEEGLAPLLYAIYLDDANMVRLLMDAGADLEVRNRFGKDLLTLALARRNPKVITELALSDSATGKKVHRWINGLDWDSVPSKNEARDFFCLKGMLQLSEAEDLQSAQEAEAILGQLRDLIGYADLDASYALMKAYSDPGSPLFDLSEAEKLIRRYSHSQKESEVAFFAKRAACGKEPLAAFLYGQALLMAATEAEKSLVYDQTEPGENNKRAETQTAGVNLIVESAEAGNPFALAYVGEFYRDLFPKASEKEIRRETIAWLTRAAEAGHIKSAYSLGYLFFKGPAASHAPQKALYWFNRAGELGACYAYCTIATSFHHGIEGFPVDPDRAVEWYRKAARCGDGQATLALAAAYEEGRLGLAVDYLEACKFYLALPESREQSEFGEKVTALVSKGLILAVQNGEVERVEKWLEMLPPEIPGRLDGWLAAAANEAPDLAEQFHKTGLDVNVSHKDRTALMIASAHGHCKTTAWLLQQGADIVQEDSFGHTALTLAAGKGRLEAVRLLLNHGAALQADAGSPSPLAEAIRGGHDEVVRLLLDEGAEMPSIESPEGKSLLAFCRNNKDSRMETLVLEAQSDDVSAAARNDAVTRLDRRDERARKTQQWLAGKLIVRLDEGGKALSAQDGTFEAAPWRCISDELSGLSWLVKDDAGGLHHKDMIFTIPGEKSAQCSAEDCDVLAYRDSARAEQVCGAADWRVPTVAELESLAYPHMAASFPHWPGFVQWARRGEDGDLVLTHASGLLGRTTGVIAFDAAGQVLLVHGKLHKLPMPASTDFTLIGFE